MNEYNMINRRIKQVYIGVMIYFAVLIVAGIILLFVNVPNILGISGIVLGMLGEIGLLIDIYRDEELKNIMKF